MQPSRHAPGGAAPASSRHKIGAVVVFEGGLADRLLARVTAGPHEDGTYDLDGRSRVRAECIRGVAGGELVDYFSASLGKWIPSQVIRLGQLPGTYDLSCKEGVDISRMRLRLADPEADPQVQTTGASDPLEELRSLQAGDHVLYNSSARGWIPARVLRLREDERLFDLDVKQCVPPQSIFMVKEGDTVEYCSASTGQWLPTKVLRVCQEPGLYDLVCKERADLRRIRPRSDSSAVPPPPLPPPPAPPHPHAPEAPAAPVPAGPRVPGSAAALASTKSAAPAACAIPSPMLMPRLTNADAERSRLLEQVRSAVQAEDAIALRHALDAAAGICVAEEEELGTARRLLWALEARPGALAEVCRTAAGSDVAAIQTAVQAAVSVGVPSLHLEFAQQRLRVLEAASARQKAQEELRVACHREDSIALSLAIESGTAAGLAHLELEQARQALCNIQAKSRAREQLRHAEMATSSVGHAEAHASLEAALRSAEAAGLRDEELTRPRTMLQRIQAPPTVAQVQLPVSNSFACTTIVGPAADCPGPDTYASLSGLRGVGMSFSSEAPPMQACPSWSLAGSEAPSTNLIMPATTTAVAPATLPATAPKLPEAALQAYPPWGAPAGVVPDTTPGLPDTAPQLPDTVPQVPTTEPQIPGTDPQVPLTDPKAGGWGTWLGLYKL